MSIFGGGGKKKSKVSIVSTTAPRIGSYTIQTSTEGIAIPLVYGMMKMPGNLVWAGNFQAIPHTTTSQSGGGGGGGGGGKGGGGKTGGGGGGTTQYDTTYTYTMAVLLGLCLGQIQGINRVWQDKSVATLGAWFEGAMSGAMPQAVWGWLQTFNAAQALQYFGLAYAYSSAVDMGANASLPNFSFEVQGLLPFDAPGSNWDANPADVLYDLLTNHYAGVGWNPALIASLTQYSNYCLANDLLLSPIYDSQQEAQQALADLLQLTNSEAFFSEGVLKVVPYGDIAATGNGATFTPNLTPLYDLTEDHFITSGPNEDPVIMNRSTPADAYNQLPLEFLDRANNYDTAIQTASDLNAIKKYGLKVASTVQAHGITTAARALFVAQLILQKLLFVRNVYQFKLPWNYCLLEPMDWVTLTDSKLGLDRLPVRIISYEEDSDGCLSMMAEEWPVGVAGSPLYGNQVKGGMGIDYNSPPGNPNPPIIFEPPVKLTQTGYEIWIAASGGPMWGGAEVWTSVDNITYVKAGVIASPARTGSLAALFAAGQDPDLYNELQVDLRESLGTLVSGSQLDADLYNTLCYVDGEIISYQLATFTGPYQYTLENYIRRGIYGTGRLAHPINSRFCRLDGAVFKYAFTPDFIGEAIYIKLLGFNIYQGGRQSLADVEPYQWTVGGTGMGAPMPDITGLTTFYQDGKVLLKWNPVTDELDGYRTADYEVRLGPTWDTSAILGRTPITQFVTQGNGTYWVSAHNGNSYSTNPADVLITAASLVKNVVSTFDDMALGWPGAMYDGVFKDVNGCLQLIGNTLVNGDFENSDMSMWSVYNAGGNTSSFARTNSGGDIYQGSYKGRWDIGTVTGYGNIVLMNIPVSNILLGKRYRVSFVAKTASDNDQDMGVNFQQNGGSFESMCIPQKVGIQKYWKKYNIIIEVTVASAGSNQARLIFIAGDRSNTYIDLDSIQVVPHDEMEGMYAVLASECLDLGNAQPCNLSASFISTAVNPQNDIDTTEDWDAIKDFDGLLADAASCTVRICMTQDNATWTDWLNFYPGKYVFRRAQFGLLLKALKQPATPVVSGFTFTIDMPDRVEQGQGVTVSVGGTAITYAYPFQSNPPNVQITIIDAVSGDFVKLKGSDADGFDIQIFNDITAVSRDINWIAQGY